MFNGRLIPVGELVPDQDSLKINDVEEVIPRIFKPIRVDINNTEVLKEVGLYKDCTFKVEGSLVLVQVIENDGKATNVEYLKHGSYIIPGIGVVSALLYKYIMNIHSAKHLILIDLYNQEVYLVAVQYFSVGRNIDAANHVNLNIGKGQLLKVKLVYDNEDGAVATNASDELVLFADVQLAIDFIRNWHDNDILLNYAKNLEELLEE